jgi:hypothetical protein
MKTFTFRLSRVISILTFLIFLLFSIFAFLEFRMFGGDEWYGFLPYSITTVVVLIPIFIFNWLCFGKFSLWIKNPYKENTIDR